MGPLREEEEEVPGTVHKAVLKPGGQGHVDCSTPPSYSSGLRVPLPPSTPTHHRMFTVGLADSLLGGSSPRTW